MYTYDDVNYERECPGCEEKDQTISGIAYWFEVVMEQLYSREQIDLTELDAAMMEIANFLKMKISDNDLQVQRSPQPRSQMQREMEAWKTWNIDYLTQLAAQ